MQRLCIFVMMTAFSYAGWYAGSWMGGFMAAFVVSGLLSLIGVYVGWSLHRRWF